MDDISRRLGEVGTDVSTIKADVAGIKARIPCLAAKSDVREARTSIIQWRVGTTIAAAALAFAVAKLVH